MYANVLIEYNVKSLDKCFTYKIPDKLKNIVKPGMQVVVPFGKTICNGIILSISDTYNDEYEIKSIYQIKIQDLFLSKIS